MKWSVVNLFGLAVAGQCPACGPAGMKGELSLLEMAGPARPLEYAPAVARKVADLGETEDGERCNVHVWETMS